MKKTLLTICALFVSISIQAQTNEVKKTIIKPSFSVEAGYTDTIISKGYRVVFGNNLSSDFEKPGSIWFITFDTPC